jgi:hypothetical protein
MGNPHEPEPRRNDNKPRQPAAGSAAAWLAECGMVALLPVEESTANGDERAHPRLPAEMPKQAAASTTGPDPDEALILRLSAQKLWSEGRANPVWYQCRSWIGDWRTDARAAPYRHAPDRSDGAALH